MFNIEPIKEVMGSFQIEKLNVKTGEKWCSNKQCNLLTENFHKALGTSENGMSGKFLNQLYIGDGSREPQESDTALTHKLWDVSINSSQVKISYDLHTITCTAKYIIPASGSYVGTISEVGLYASLGLVTHSLLKDAENHPYSINKTDLDQLTIIYTITMQINTINKIIIDPVKRLCTWNGVEFAQFCFYEATYYTGCASLTFLKSFLWKGNLIERFTSSNSARVQSSTISCSLPFSAPTQYRAGVCTYNAADRTLSVPRRRVLVDSWLNGHFINMVCPFGHSGNTPTLQMIMPNPAVFPVATLTDYSIGEGDGVTTDFIPPIPMWIKNSEEIYIDDVLQVRDVDYTVDNFHNCQNNFELLPSSHMMLIEGLVTTSNYPWLCSSSDMNLDSNLAIDNYSTVIDPEDVKPGGQKLAIDYKGENVFYMFGEEDLGLDSTVSEAYLTTPNRASSNPVSLAYSNDGETWTTLLNEVRFDECTLSRTPLSSLTKHEFEPIKAKFWKVTIRNNSPTLPINSFGIVLKHSRQPLRFNNPPAAGSIIKMNCQIDRPFKDENHVLDVVGTIQL